MQVLNKLVSTIQLDWLRERKTYIRMRRRRVVAAMLRQMARQAYQKTISLQAIASSKARIMLILQIARQHRSLHHVMCNAHSRRYICMKCRKSPRSPLQAYTQDLRLHNSRKWSTVTNAVRSLGGQNKGERRRMRRSIIRRKAVRMTIGMAICTRQLSPGRAWIMRLRTLSSRSGTNCETDEPRDKRRNVSIAYRKVQQAMYQIPQRLFLVRSTADILLQAKTIASTSLQCDLLSCESQLYASRNAGPAILPSSASRDTISPIPTPFSQRTAQDLPS